MEQDGSGLTHRQIEWTFWRLKVMERALADIFRRLGVPEKSILAWLKEADTPGYNITGLFGAMNEVLANMKPPPKR